jgi:hypothetical protein
MIGGACVCLMTHFTGRMCNVWRGYSISGSLTRVILPPAYRSSTIYIYIQLQLPASHTLPILFPSELTSVPILPARCLLHVSHDRSTNVNNPQLFCSKRHRTPPPPLTPKCMLDRLLLRASPIHHTRHHAFNIVSARAHHSDDLEVGGYC